jgi:transcriptional regulator GlxA family with amidase domain
MAQQVIPKVRWNGEKQWVIDGKFRTAGGAFAATDMFAHWVMKNYGRDVGEGRIYHT